MITNDWSLTPKKGCRGILRKPYDIKKWWKAELLAEVDELCDQLNSQQEFYEKVLKQRDRCIAYWKRRAKR